MGRKVLFVLFCIFIGTSPRRQQYPEILRTVAAAETAPRRQQYPAAQAISTSAATVAAFLDRFIRIYTL
jgi:hypothetical protein